MCCFKGKPKCGKCGRFRHEAKKCWGGKLLPRFPKRGCANVALDPQEDEEMEAYINNVPESFQNNDSVIFYSWIADSATISHITNQTLAFINYTSIKAINNT